jgi:AraC-like DNA-binding protein
MQEHYADPLRIERVARVAGFAPDYFCRLFKSDEGVTPEVYLQRLRVERAKQMLTKTNFAVESVGKLCGLPCRNYFHRLFKRTAGVTPHQYRMRES